MSESLVLSQSQNENPLHSFPSRSRPEIGLTSCGRWHVYFQLQQDRPLPGRAKGNYRLTLQFRMLEIMDKRLAIGYHMWPAPAFPFKTENGVTRQYYNGPKNFDIVVS
ncbi:hypothetical protein DL768_007528 [Monosporascus sp. mg162]|nr:hypothetical protein DL768_007528 [Monosporascus sp. mg162]